MPDPGTPRRPRCGVDGCREGRIASDVLVELDDNVAPRGDDLEDKASTRPLGEDIPGLREHIGIPDRGILGTRLEQGVLGIADQSPVLDFIPEPMPDLEIPVIPDLGLLTRDGHHGVLCTPRGLPDLTVMKTTDALVRYPRDQHGFLPGPTKK